MNHYDRVLFMENRPLLHEGTQKNLYDTRDPGVHILHFKDQLLDETGTQQVVEGKGVHSNRISACVFKKLNEMGFLTHFIQIHNMREQMVHALEIFPFSLVVRNKLKAPFVTDLGFEEGPSLTSPVIEFRFKKGNHMLNDSHIDALGFATREEMDEMRHVALRVNDFVTGFFTAIGIQLVDISLEFGRYFTPLLDDTQLMLADEISPDTCSLICGSTLSPLGRHAPLDHAARSYQDIASRIHFTRDPLDDAGVDKNLGVFPFKPRD